MNTKYNENKNNDNRNSIDKNLSYYLLHIKKMGDYEYEQYIIKYKMDSRNEYSSVKSKQQFKTLVNKYPLKIHLRHPNCQFPY